MNKLEKQWNKFGIKTLCKDDNLLTGYEIDVNDATICLYQNNPDDDNDEDIIILQFSDLKELVEKIEEAKLKRL